MDSSGSCCTACPTEVKRGTTTTVAARAMPAQGQDKIHAWSELQFEARFSGLRPAKAAAALLLAAQPPAQQQLLPAHQAPAATTPHPSYPILTYEHEKGQAEPHGLHGCSQERTRANSARFAIYSVLRFKRLTKAFLQS